MDEVKIIEDDGYVIGFEINSKMFHAEEGFVEAQISELDGFNIGSMPDGFFIMPLDGNTIIIEGRLASSDRYPGIALMNIHRYRKYWYHRFGASQYFNAMREAISQRAESDGDVEFMDLSDDGAHIFFQYNILLTEDMPIEIAFKKFTEVVSEIEGYTERILNKEEISPNILEDDKAFTLKILLPLRAREV